MEGADENEAGSYSTGRLAALGAYSAQQVRDLERRGVIPAARRQDNGYRQYGAVHVVALRAYRQLATAVGPVVARTTMREMYDLPSGEAVASIVALHTGLARSREQTLAALSALETIVDESAHEDAPTPGDSMSITELSGALGVRSSTLRFWERKGLITPERATSLQIRRYPPAAVNDARIVAALRASGYRIPAVQAVMASLHSAGGTHSAREALGARLHTIAAQSEALLVAGTDIVELLRRASGSAPPPDGS